MPSLNTPPKIMGVRLPPPKPRGPELRLPPRREHGGLGRGISASSIGSIVTLEQQSSRLTGVPFDQVADTEMRLAERERAVIEAELRVAEKQRELAETENLLAAREQLLAAARRVSPTPKLVSEEERAALFKLQASLDRQEAILKEQQATLQEREAFLEASEIRLFEKVEEQQENAALLEQREEDLRAQQASIHGAGEPEFHDAPSGNDRQNV